MREIVQANPGKKLTGKAERIIETLRELEAGQAELTFDRKSVTLAGDAARYAGSVARGYLKKLVS